MARAAIKIKEVQIQTKKTFVSKIKLLILLYNKSSSTNRNHDLPTPPFMSPSTSGNFPFRFMLSCSSNL